METIEQRFENFKNFLNTIPGIDSKYIILIGQCNLNVFLTGIDQHKDKTIEELTKYISEVAKIDLNNIPIEMKSKFTRYLEYFRLITQLNTK